MVLFLEEDERNFRIKLMYDNNRRSAIMSIKRVSKPGRRWYVPASKMHILGGHGVAVVSTSKGRMTGKEAKRLNVGGELV